ncbi:MAG: hypothetical protein RLZZ512_1920 [Bacteroidota bacterium]
MWFECNDYKTISQPRMEYLLGWWFIFGCEKPKILNQASKKSTFGNDCKENHR